MREALDAQGSDVFLASDDADVDAARELVRLLELQHWSVFWERAPQASDRYLAMIEGELKACRCAIALWSHHSTAGAHSDRAAYVIGRGRLLNLRLSDCDIPLELNDAPVVDLIGYPELQPRAPLHLFLSHVAGFVRSSSEEHFDLGQTLSVRVANRVLACLHASGIDAKPPGMEQEFGVGPWRVLPERNLLKSDELEIVLRPLVMSVLQELVRNAGHTVSKDQLLDTVWEGRIVGDAVVHTTIASLRNSLGARPMVYIETVARKGYRLAAPVT